MMWPGGFPDGVWLDIPSFSSQFLLSPLTPLYYVLNFCPHLHQQEQSIDIGSIPAGSISGLSVGSNGLRYHIYRGTESLSEVVCVAIWAGKSGCAYLFRR